MRKYLPTLGELIDRLTIVQLKEVKIPQHKEEYQQEIKDIVHDINQILLDEKLGRDIVDGDMISAESLKKKLQAGVDKLEQETVLQAAASDASANSAKRQKFVLADCMDLNAMVDDLAIGDWLALKGLDAKILL